MIVFLDLDNFKLVNDTHGHQKGDELLKAVAMGMLSSSRSSETVARLSGDEFVLIAANANKRAAEAVGQRLVDTVREICRGVVPDIKVGASVGIVLVENAVGMTAEDVIQLADDAMYGVKNASKNAFDVRVIGAQSA